MKASLSAASFNALISAQGKAGCIAAAETTFGMMLSARVEPSQAPAPALAPAQRNTCQRKTTRMPSGSRVRELR